MSQYFAGQIVTDAELNSGAAQTDITQFSGTPVALTQESKLWDIPANIAQTSSSWRLTVFGKSVLGGTALGQWFYIGFGPSGATQIEVVQFSSSNQPINSTWWFTFTIHMVVNVGSATGNASVFGTVCFSDSGSVGQAGWTNGAVAQSFNNTVDNKLCMLFTYTAATGAPVLTTYGSIFERMS